MKTKTIAIVAMLLATACMPENRVFEEHQKLSPDVEWKREDVRIFEVNITDTSAVYDFSISFRYAQGYPYELAIVNMTEVTPSGNTKTDKLDLLIREESGEYIGEPGYDIWDSTHLIESGRKYGEPGVYTYTIQHSMRKDPLPFAMEVGIIVDKVVPSN